MLFLQGVIFMKVFTLALVDIILALGKILTRGKENPFMKINPYRNITLIPEITFPAYSGVHLRSEVYSNLLSKVQFFSIAW